MTKLPVKTGGEPLRIACLLKMWACLRCAVKRMQQWFTRQPCLIPPLEPGMKIEIEVNKQTYRTTLWDIEQEILWLLPPLQSGIPVRFPPHTPIELRLHAPGGLFSACTVVESCRTQPQSLTGLAVPRHWTCEQRRLHPRIALLEERPAVVEINQHRITGWLQDLSAGGARLHALRALPAGDAVCFYLNSSDAPIPGRVVDCRRVLHNTTYQYEMRITFENPQTLSLCTPSTSP